MDQGNTSGGGKDADDNKSQQSTTADPPSDASGEEHSPERALSEDQMDRVGRLRQQRNVTAADLVSLGFSIPPQLDGMQLEIVTTEEFLERLKNKPADGTWLYGFLGDIPRNSPQQAQDHPEQELGELCEICVSDTHTTEDCPELDDEALSSDESGAQPDVPSDDQAAQFDSTSKDNDTK
ncbi:hypothetical protein ONZ43_g4225 [Nemania bipapillata]|uniref:Uncharacterized protein n=1 Tax=Nemania bipapillata TaxID=110536 RepID=A0ACC2IQ84_9PEZI|nr:hypothetical protein ONZ43_g4225 [Nemania bipapillata]